MNSDRIAKLKERRMRLAELEEHKHLRARHGAQIVRDVEPATGPGYTLNDFRVDATVPFEIQWPNGAEEANGSYVPWIDEAHARRIATCLRERLGRPEGLLGIFGNSYLGLVSIAEVSIPGMVDACQKTNDSVVFYPHGIEGALIFDCYATPGAQPFTVLIQGVALIEAVAGCV